MSYESYKSNINAALGKENGDLLLKNACYVNFFTAQLEYADILINNGIIVGIGSYDNATKIIDCTGKIVTPGFVDCHIHLESNIISPIHFARIASSHGTTALLTDPHEIVNVSGTAGLDYMLNITKDLPLDVYFMLPSCVPASGINDNYGPVLSTELKPYYENPRVLGLAEMMNFPGVLSADREIYNKIKSAKRVDGHSPMLSGKELDAYLTAGIHTEHECTSFEEGLEKLKKGMYIFVREGSGAKNLKSLVGLIKKPYAYRVMLCVDDKEPDELVKNGHIDFIVRKAIKLGADPITALMCASYTPSIYLGTNTGSISVGKNADVLILDNLTDVNVLTTIKNGKIVYDGDLDLANEPVDKNSAFRCMDTPLKTDSDFTFTNTKYGIELIPHELITNKIEVTDTDSLCMVAVFERYHNSTSHAMCYLKGYGLKEGAIATTIAHDSHNIIVVGKDIESMKKAVNTIIENGGGMIMTKKDSILGFIKLDIAGLMTTESTLKVISELKKTKDFAYKYGVNKDIDPFLNLSFLSLPVIPFAKITPKGLVDVLTQEIIKE